MKRRVVVTGMGAITPIGNNIVDFWESLKNGKSGIAKITKFPEWENQKNTIAAEVKDFNYEDYGIERLLAKRNDLYTLYALASTKEAMDDSGLVEGNYDPFRSGVIMSSGIGGLNTIQDEIVKAQTKGWGRISSLYIPMAITNIATGNVAIRHNFKGYSASITTACAAGSQSIGEAFEKIIHNKTDVMICGGAEASITESGISGFANLTATYRGKDPERASIPFDKERGGFIMGEGSGTLILEELDHAKKRGAKIYAEIVGYGATTDAYHITAPSTEGPSNAMKQALEDANIPPEKIDYINAHGTGTPINDLNETICIKNVFGKHAYKVSISSTKSMTGHCLGATGALEAIISILAINNNLVPPTINHKVKDPELDLDYTFNKAKKREVKYAMTNSMGFGGHNVSLIFKEYDEAK